MGRHCREKEPLQSFPLDFSFPVTFLTKFLIAKSTFDCFQLSSNSLCSEQDLDSRFVLARFFLLNPLYQLQVSNNDMCLWQAVDKDIFVFLTKALILYICYMWSGSLLSNISKEKCSDWKDNGLGWSSHISPCTHSNFQYPETFTWN